MPKTTKNSTNSSNKSSNRNVCRIVCIIIGILAIIAIIVATIFAFVNHPIDSSYFVTDDTKLVLNLTVNNENAEGDNISLVAAHAVYCRQDDKITCAKTYYEFTDPAAAKTAYTELINSLEADDKNSYDINGKYIIITAPAEVYTELSVKDVESQIEFYESLQKGELPEQKEDVIIEESEETEE